MTQTEEMETAAQTTGGTEDQYLTFVLGREQYAVDVAHVQTVVEFTEITRIPRMPEFMLGVINFRGSVLPVIDLKKKLGLTGEQGEERLMIIVLEVPFESGVLSVGATADAVRQVVDIEASSIEDAPAIGSKADREFIRGIGRRDDEFVIILDTRSIFREQELTALSSVAEEPAER